MSESERALCLEHVFGGLEGDAERSRDVGAGVGEDNELEVVLLGSAQRLVGLLGADRGERRPVAGHCGTSSDWY